MTKKLEDILNLPDVKEAFKQVDKKEQARSNKDHTREVQKNVKVKIGDKVVTSGFSDIYPSGLPVGSVSGVLDDRGSFQKVVNIKLPSDITSFQNVFVIVEKIDEMD